MNRIIPIVVSILVVAGATFVQGRWTDRWGLTQTQELDDFALFLENVPMQIGDWKCEEEAPEDDAQKAQLERAKVIGKKIRIYANAKTGEEVRMFLVCGTARNLFQHTPMQCYPAAGYEMVEEPIEHPVPFKTGGNSADFATTTFRKEHDLKVTSHLQIFWSFTGDGNWQGPSAPKYKFGGTPALYKIYLVTQVAQEQWIKDPTTSPCHYFAAELMPALEEALFSNKDVATEEVATEEVVTEDAEG